MKTKWFIVPCITILFSVSIVHISHGAEDWTHKDVWLKNERGGRITPSQNSTDPYSPRKTCGGCHAYSTITKGFHFQQGFDVISDSFDPGKPWITSPGMFGKW
jgi:hypothetical protein